MSQMNTKILVPALIALMGVSAGAWADQPDFDGEVTMRLMPPSEAEQLPEAVTNRIALPALVLENGTANDKVEKARDALEKAENRGTAGRQHGWSHANEAREQAQDMAENAKAKNENRGRSEDRPDRPDRPEPPGPPESPPGQN
jgi:hypothetical protein